MFKNVKKLICILSVTTILIGSIALPSLATSSSTTNWLGIDTQSKTPTPLTDQQKKALLDDINRNTKLSKKFGKIDVSSATNAELQDYGIPDRPTDPQELKQWNETWGKVKEVIKPEFSIGDARGGFTWPNGKPASSLQDGIWSGCINGDAGLPAKFNPTGYQNVIGMFYVPNLSTNVSKSANPSDVMIWAGIGGSNGEYLIQDGVHAKYDTRFSGTPYRYLPFWELYSTDPSNHYWNSQEVVVDNFPINPNDYISVGITLGAGGADASMKIFDQTTGQMTFMDPQTYNCVDNGCAEWITEAPQVNGVIDNLVDYGIVNWQGSYSYGSIGANQARSACLANTSAIKSDVVGINMQKNGVVESQVSDPTSSNTFNTTWLAK